MEKANQPSVVGEILAGILLGTLAAFLPTNIHLWNFNFDSIIPDFNPSTNPAFFELAQVGIIFLLFTSGLHVTAASIKRTRKASMTTAIGGVLFPFTFGVLLGYVLGFSPIACMAAGAIFTATSVGITVRALMDMDLLRTDIAVVVHTTAVIDDVIAIVLLTLVLAGAGGHGGTPIFALDLVLAILLLLYLIAGFRRSEKLSKLGEKFRKLGSPKSLVSITLVLCFLMSALAEIVILVAITGAFLIGILVGSSKNSRFVTDEVGGMARLVFIPLFFFTIGTQVKLQSFIEAGPLILLFIPLAISGKIVGCSLGAIIGGFENRKALKIGVGMVPKMEIALVVVSTTIALGVFEFPGAPPGLGDQILAVTVLHVIITALITPILLKRLFQREEEDYRPSTHVGL